MTKRKAHHTYTIDRWSARFCFNCPLPDCVTTESPHCPINKARRIEQERKTMYKLPLFSGINQPGGQA